MQFRGSNGTPPHQNRRLQLRMLGFVGLIAVIMFGWKAFRVASDRSLQVERLADAGTDDVEEADSSRPPGLKDGEFRIPPPDDEPENNDPIAAEPKDALENAAEVRIPSDWLAGVKDNLIGIRQSEAHAYFRVLAKARAVPPAELRAAADADASYATLTMAPNKFRGRPVTVVGDLRTLFAYDAPPNDYGITQLYDAWILTADSGNQPYRVVCQAIPAELTPGTDLNQSVKVTGYFFKKEAYETKAGVMNTAPTLLANRLTAYIPPQAVPAADEGMPWMIGITVVVLAMVATAIGFAVADARKKVRPNLSANITSADARMLSAAEDRRLSVEEALQRLENDEPLEDNLRPAGYEREPASAPSGNGHSTEASELPDELLELPTPFPPTRVPKRWEEN